VSGTVNRESFKEDTINKRGRRIPGLIKWNQVCQRKRLPPVTCGYHTARQSLTTCHGLLRFMALVSPMTGSSITLVGKRWTTRWPIYLLMGVESTEDVTNNFLALLNIMDYSVSLIFGADPMEVDDLTEVNDPMEVDDQVTSSL
jgi:hypothetical protein